MCPFEEQISGKISWRVLIKAFFVLGGCSVFLLLYLFSERILLNQRIRGIPLRICVTGTRGKSSVTRLIAAALRESGFKVLAKTTGAKPVIIFPDGQEKEIKRKDVTSILEQKKLLKIGEKLKIDALVSELMSIHPESCYVESVQILRPHIIIVTNVRLDHQAQWGSSKEEIAQCFASSIPEKSTVLIPQEELYPVFQKTALKRESKIIQVPKQAFEECFQSERRLPFFELEVNIRLVLAVAGFLGIDHEVAFRGIAKFQPDFGSLKVWRTDWDSPPRSFLFVSLFAANDPESTRLVLSDLLRRKILDGKRILGILNLRRDRGDRSLQWLNVLKAGAFPEFNCLYLIGFHARALKRRLNFLDKESVCVLKKRAPEKIMEQIIADQKEDAVLVGLGNIAGAGKELVDYWEKTGKAYDL